jgi:integrase
MRDRRDRVHGPYERVNSKGTWWRVVAVSRVGEAERRVYSYKTEAEALEAKAHLERKAAEANQAHTVNSAVAAYLATLDGRVAAGELRACTVERNGFHLRAMLKLGRHGERDLRVLTPGLGARLYEERTGAVDTHRNGLAVVKSFGAWCVVQGWLKANPFAEVKGKGRRKRGKEQLTRDESAALYAHCLELAERDVGAVATLAYQLLGVRATELLSRPVRDLDAGGTVLRVERTKSAKGDRDLVVPRVLRPHLVRLAKGRPALAPLIEAAQHRKRLADWAREQVRRMCRGAGVREVTPQGLRGTVGTIARELGNSAEAVAEFLGHTVEVSNRSYVDQARVEAAQQARALRVLEGGR